jgi:hypothetical protein
MAFLLVVISQLVQDEGVAICRESSGNAWHQRASVCRSGTEFNSEEQNKSDEGEPGIVRTPWQSIVLRPSASLKQTSSQKPTSLAV